MDEAGAGPALRRSCFRIIVDAGHRVVDLLLQRARRTELHNPARNNQRLFSGPRISAEAPTLRAALNEARAFLALPASPASSETSAYDASEAARRLWRRCRAIGGTHAEAYLHARGLTHCSFPALRFHPELFYRDGDGMRRLPALIAAITGNDGVLTGVQRTWLDPRAPAKAKVAHPRKALGRIHGLAVRFGNIPADSVATLLVGEGIETVLSLITAVPFLFALPPRPLFQPEVSASSHRLPALPASSSPATTTARVNAPPNASHGTARTPALKPPSSSPNATILTMT